MKGEKSREALRRGDVARSLTSSPLHPFTPSVVRRALRQTAILLEMIKFEHTLFTLPFALMSTLIAAGGWPSPRVLGWILLAMVGARSSGMAFNRLVDIRYDR